GGSGARLELDPSVHQLGELTRNRKPEAAAGGDRPLEPEEALEDVALGVRGDAGAIVRNGETGPLVVQIDNNGHRRAGRGVDERVVDEDAADLQHPFLVGERRDGGAKVELEPVLRGGSPRAE